MTDKTILIACDTKDVIDWHLIKPLQGNYKKLTEINLEKLCHRIIKRGIRFPSFVSKISGKVYAIDTHQRLKAYAELEKQGYTLPAVPIVYIKAKNITEAKQLLLECDSRYGEVMQEGYEEFIEDLDLSAFESELDKNEFYNDLEIPNIDVFQAEYKNINSELSFDDNEIYKVTLKYDGETYETVKFAMEKRTESPEQIFREALGV